MSLGDGLHDVPAGKVVMAVTHLEMRQPQLRGTALPQGLSFERIAPNIQDYRDLFRHIGQDWLWYGRLVMSDATLQDILDDPHVHIFTVMQNGKPEALLELDFRVDRACELAYFGLSHALIGTGAGAYLMDRAVSHAFDAPIDRFHVHTCSIDSPQALGFYIRSGFTPYRRQVEVDDDPRVLGLLPQHAAPHVPIIQP